MKTITIINYGSIREGYNAYIQRVKYIISQCKNLGYIIYVLEFPEECTSVAENWNGIHIISLKGNEVKYKFMTKILSFDILKFFRFNIYAMKELYKNRKYIINADLIVIENPILISILISKLFSKKIVLDLHEVSVVKYSNIKNKLHRLIRKIGWYAMEGLSLRLSDKIIVISEYEKNIISKLYHINPNKICIIPLLAYDKNKSLNKSIIPIKKYSISDKLVITYIGDLYSKHNFEAVQFIIDHLAPYFTKYDDVVFLIVGRGNELFKSNKLNNVYFTGYVEDISAIYNITDICIAPVTAVSGYLFKILEYICYKKPIVATKESVQGLDNINYRYNGLFTCTIDDFILKLEKIINLYRKGDINIQHTTYNDNQNGILFSQIIKDLDE